MGVVDGRWTEQDKKEKRCALAKTFKSKDERRLAHHQGGTQSDSEFIYWATVDGQRADGC